MMSIQRKTLSPLEKEQLLLDKLEQTKLKLAKLREKRKLEIGELAVKCGLAQFDDEQLLLLFESMMRENSVDYTAEH